MLNPTEKQIRRQLAYKRSGDYTYAILEDEAGNFIQVYGGGSGCCLEWKNNDAHIHYRATQNPPKVPWKGKTKLGNLVLEQEEFFIIDQVTEAFIAFLLGADFPQYIFWKDISTELRDAGITV